MAKTFGYAERHILSLFNIGASFTYDRTGYTVIKSGKPTCGKGEPKTDIYIAAEDVHHNIAEFKISFKKQNADFLKIRPLLNVLSSSLVQTGKTLFLTLPQLFKMNSYLVC